VGPRERDRQILFDCHPGLRVILPTPEGIRVARIEDLMLFAAVWTIDGGTQDYDYSRIHSSSTIAGVGRAGGAPILRPISASAPLRIVGAAWRLSHPFGQERNQFTRCASPASLMCMKRHLAGRTFIATCALIGAVSLGFGATTAASAATPTAVHPTNVGNCYVQWHVKGNGVRLRSEPWVGSTIRGLGYNGDNLGVYSFNGGWDYVTDYARNVTGWISTDYMYGTLEC
jgi:hypothetical protein